MKSLSSSPTLMSTTMKLDKHEQGKNMNFKRYRGMIDILLYLKINNSDIVFNVCLYAKFKTSPSQSHICVVKCIFRYLKGTIRLVFWYHLMNNFYLTSYSNSNFTGCTVDKKKH